MTPTLSKTPTQDRLAAVEAELKQRGPLTALAGGTFYLRLSKREAELAALKKADARAPGMARPGATARRATGLFDHPDTLENRLKQLEISLTKFGPVPAADIKLTFEQRIELRTAQLKKLSATLKPIPASPARAGLFAAAAAAPLSVREQFEAIKNKDDQFKFYRANKHALLTGDPGAAAAN